MSRILNLAVVDRSQSSISELPTNDHKYSVLAYGWSKAIDIFSSPRGVHSVNLAITFLIRERYTGPEDEIGPNSNIVRQLGILFLNFLKSKSPLLVYDQTMTNSATVAEHPRGSWEGHYSSFNVRAQAIKVNSYWVDASIQTWRLYAARPTDVTSAAFQLGLFKLVHAMVHETGHLLQTFLSKGGEETPPGVSGGRHTRGSDQQAGEAGEMIERLIFGGLVDFYDDETPLGGTPVGYPYITSLTEDEVRRVDLHSVGSLLQPDWQSDNYQHHIIRRDSRTFQLDHPPHGRPTLHGHTPVGLMSPRAARAETVPDYQGHDVDARAYSQISSPPVRTNPLA